jgi:hypothetical protein
MSTEFEDLRLDDFGSQEGQPGEAACLIARYEPGVSGEHDCRKSALDALCRIF